MARAAERKNRLIVAVGLALLVGHVPRTLRAEGTAQLGTNQQLVEGTEIKVDVVAAGELINIAVGNASATDAAPVLVTVVDPQGYPLSSSPYSVGPGDDGFLDAPGQVPETIARPLRIVADQVGTYTVTFDNTRSDMGTSSWANVVDPFDITVTPDGETPVDPAVPPRLGRVHSARWMLNARGYTQEDASNASFYVLTPTKIGADHTWLLQLNGLAGGQFDLRGNDVGLPAPLSFMSVEELVTAASCPAGYQRTEGQGCAAIPPAAQYEIYLNLPAVARGGDQGPRVEELSFSGAGDAVDCAVAGAKATFRFTSDAQGSYSLMIDLDRDGQYDPVQELLRAGTVEPGANLVEWDGRDRQGEAVAVGSYDVQLAVRIGEFHVVGKDIETANPGLRIFSVVPPKLDVTPRATQMFWNDAAINDRPLKIQPEMTLPEGISSGSYADAPVCSAPGAAGVNAHCWGNFSSEPTLSPGDGRYIDTWVYFKQATAGIQICVADDGEFFGIGGGGGCGIGGVLAEPGLPAWLLLVVSSLLLVCRKRSGSRSSGATGSPRAGWPGADRR